MMKFEIEIGKHSEAGHYNIKEKQIEKKDSLKISKFKMRSFYSFAIIQN